MSDQSSGGISPLQLIQSHCEEARIHGPTTVVESQKNIAQWSAAILENSVLYVDLTAVSDAFKVERELLKTEINKLKSERSPQQGGKFNAKLAKLRKTDGADVSALKDKALDFDQSN